MPATAVWQCLSHIAVTTQKWPTGRYWATRIDDVSLQTAQPVYVIYEDAVHALMRRRAMH